MNEGLRLPVDLPEVKLIKERLATAAELVESVRAMLSPGEGADAGEGSDDDGDKVTLAELKSMLTQLTQTRVKTELQVGRAAWLDGALLQGNQKSLFIIATTLDMMTFFWG